jgi:hypothetical protein
VASVLTARRMADGKFSDCGYWTIPLPMCLIWERKALDLEVMPIPSILSMPLPPSRKNSHINAFQRRMQKAEDLASWRNKFRVT